MILRTPHRTRAGGDRQRPDSSAETVGSGACP